MVRRRYANDCVWLIVEYDGFSQNGSIRSEGLLPKAMADNRYTVGSRTVIFLGEVASLGWGHSHNFEERCRNLHAIQVLRMAGTGQVNAQEPQDRQILERMALRLPIQIFRVGNRHGCG